MIREPKRVHDGHQALDLEAWQGVGKASGRQARKQAPTGGRALHALGEQMSRNLAELDAHGSAPTGTEMHTLALPQPTAHLVCTC